jgi:hypothetical protein
MLGVISGVEFRLLNTLVVLSEGVRSGDGLQFPAAIGLFLGF